MDLKTPVGKVSFAYKRYARRLEKLNIKTLEDFLYHIPFRYEDYSLISKIAQVQEGELVTIRGKVLEIKNDYTRRWKTVQKAKIADDSGIISVIWFNQPFLLNIIHKNDLIFISGKIKLYKNKPTLQSPEYEVANGFATIHTGRLVPIYPETLGISSKWLRRQIYKILKDYKQNLNEHLPSSIINQNNLMGFSEAIEQIHFPKNQDSAKNAKYRLAFDELLLMQLRALARRNQWTKNLSTNSFSITKFKNKIKKFWEKLPFTLTNAQKKVVSEIFNDLAGKKPMNRLLEGDVGSGKTVVCAIAMYLAFLNRFKSVLMAPTEILANQHYHTISKLLSLFGVKVSLIIGSKKQKMPASPRLASPLARGEKNKKWDILIGTHALLYNKINFENLGLVVIDEQQRFGVEQRAIIRKKGKNPHLLTMTATPIPRTIALTLYGDLDLSLLDEMPKGRKEIKTWFVPLEKREAAYRWITSQLLTFPATAGSRKRRDNSQAFVVCPFIEESESMQTVKAASKEYEYLKKNVFPKLRLGLLHGKLKAKEKEEVLKKFKEKTLDVLVATPVVEVGIDFPNATIIVIEGAERFGLSQLHQLRGRVGRGNKQSYCLLFTESKNPQTIKRLKSMETMHVGSELAELDLKLRGQGEIYGIMQHGLDQLKIASFSDFPLIEKTKKTAEKIFPKLEKYPLLFGKIQTINSQQVSPD